MKKWLAVLVILSLAAILRFYRLEDLFVFGGDEEYQSILAQTIVKHLHIIWIGVTAGHLGFYLGPLWTYFTAFWLFLSKGNPLITGYVAAAMGVLTTGLIIYTGKKLFNEQVGLSAGLLYASLPLNVFFDQKYWNPSLVPLLSVGMLLSLSQTKNNPKWWLVFFLLFGLVFHTHLSLMPYFLIALFLFFKTKGQYKIFFLGGLIFLIIYSPLIFFDYFHKGSNISTPLKLKELSLAPSVQIAPKRHFGVFFQTLGRIWYLNKNTSNADNILYSCSPFAYLDNTSKLVDKLSTRTKPNFWLSFFSLIILIYFLIESFRKNHLNWRLLSWAIILISFSYLFLPIATHEYYLLGIFPLILFIPGILISSTKHLWVWGIVLIISILGVMTVLSASDDFGLNHKQRLISRVLNIIGPDTFEIDQEGVCQHFGGWRYLFKISGRLPERGVTDQNLGWLYPEEITNRVAKYRIIFHEARAPIQLNLADHLTLREGGFNVYIIKNVGN